MYKENHLNLGSILECSSRDYPDKTALIFDDKEFAYQTINVAANRIANRLTEIGIGKGDRVALSCPNLPYFPMVYFGILKTGAVVVPLNILLKRKEIAYHLEDSEAMAYFCFIGTDELPMGREGHAAFSKAYSCKHFWMITPGNLESPIENVPTLQEMMSDNPDYTMKVTNANEPAVILYTSGTTGKPKGAVLSHMNIYMNALTINVLFRSTHEDIQLITVPLFHSFGQVVQMNAGMMIGNTIVLIPRFEPSAVLSAMQKNDVTIFAGVPTMYWGLLNYEDTDKIDLEKISNTLRLGFSGASAMPVELMKRFEEKFKINILEGYGLSETSPGVSFSRFSKKKKPGSVGIPGLGIEMKIIDKHLNDVEETGEVGEIVVRGPNVMLGYLNNPEANEKAFIEGGWLRTGDLGKKDEDGYYFIVDRLKEMIIRGGYNVYPREVEEMMMEHPAISLVAVVGEPDEEYGEEIAAYVILKDGNQTTREEIIEWCRDQMADYKFPRKVYIKEELPQTATGKILKRSLKEK